MPKKVLRGRMVVIEKSQTLPRVQRILATVLSVVVMVGLAGVVFAGVIKADSGSWAEGDMPALTLGENSDGSVEPTCSPSSIKYTAYYSESGNYLNTPREVTAPACAAANGLGEFANLNTYNGYASFEFIRPNTSFAYRVLDPTGRQKSLLPVPNQNRFVYLDTINFTVATSIRIMDSFGAHGTFGKFGYGSGVQKTEMAYRFDTLPNRLIDVAGQPIAVRNWAFSNNGEWMAVQAGQGLIRINTRTSEMLLFSNLTLTYDLGYSPTMTLAISDDGQTAISSVGEGEVRMHELQGCVPAPINTQRSNTPPAGCKSRPVNEVFTAQVANFRSLFDLRFTDGGKSLSGQLAYGSGDNLQIRLYRHFTLTVAGYQPPHTSYLALGDSFSSGEGTFDYEQGTDERDPQNLCHLSKKSYPYLVANVLGSGDGQFHNVACSGAKTDNYYRDRQAAVQSNGNLGEWLPGREVQQTYLRGADKTDAVTISMIGNDIGFSNKIKRCLAIGDPCFHFREDRASIASEINSRYDTLIKLYGDIKKDSKGARVYVLSYPQLFSTEGECALNAPLDAEERAMSRGLVTYLNTVIRTAAHNAGVKYIDVENAFAGRELCGTQSPKAVNGLTRGNDTLFSRVGPVGNESFHPNAYGHQLMSQALLAQSDNLTAPMPAVPDAANATRLPATDSAVYRNFVDNAPSGGILQRASYVTIDTINDVVVKGQPIHITVPLQLRDTFEFWFNSEPVYAGSLTTDETGSLQGSIVVPESLEPGFHTLHMYGHNIASETVDISQTVYVADSETDYDGDGIANQDEACLVSEDTGVDQDRDSIDDACDGEIAEAPADTVPPVVTGTLDRGPNANGWYNADGTIAWTADDPEPSSGVPTQPAPTFVSTEGEHEYTSGQSCDPAGNCTTGTYTVKLDKTAPTIDFRLSSAPTVDGWHNRPVTVTFICNDVLSGVAECPEPVTVEDGSVILTEYTVDRAGNSGGVNVIIAIDKNKPQVRQTNSPSANAVGWHNVDVTVFAECDDEESGIANCSSPVILNGEGASQLVTSTAVDWAGNMTEATTFVSIDKTAPVLGALNWSRNPKPSDQTAVLTVDAVDALSGVIEAEYFLGDADPGQGNGATMVVDEDGNLQTTHGTDFPTGVYKVSVRARDAAGNWSAPTSDYLVVYNPTGTRMTGKRTITPSLTNGDVLPGLNGDGQDDVAKFGFNVRYGSAGKIHRSSDFQFSYRTGTRCHGPSQAPNCHELKLNAISIYWLATQGANDSTGIFQGTANLEVDGAITTVLFRLTGMDGERLDGPGSTPDHLSLRIYNMGDNPNTAMPLYRVDGQIERGNIRIRVNG